MKSKTKKNHPLGACGTDTNKSRVFEVVLMRTQDCYCRLSVPASSEDEASRNAVMLAPHLMLGWTKGFEKISPCSVTEIKKEQRK